MPKLAANKEYTFRACGVNGAGKGSFGPPGVFNTLVEPLQMMEPPFVRPCTGHPGCHVVEWDALPKGCGKEVEVQVRQVGAVASVATGGAAGAAGAANCRCAHGKAGGVEEDEEDDPEEIDFDELSFEGGSEAAVVVGTDFVSLGQCRPFENRLVVRGLHAGTMYAYRVRMVQLDPLLLGPFSSVDEAPAEWVGEDGTPGGGKGKEIPVFDGDNDA